MASHPLMFLDNDALLKIVGNGTFKIQPISFEEARAIIEMHMGREDVVRCFDDLSLSKIVFEYLGLPKRDFPYTEARRMEVEQDGILFRRYITESVTQPLIKTEYGNEAKKIQNVYIHCELVSRLV